MYCFQVDGAEVRDKETRTRFCDPKQEMYYFAVYALFQCFARFQKAGYQSFETAPEVACVYQ